MRNATIQVLQSLNYEKKTGFSCSLEITRKVQYCGNCNNITIYNPLGMTRVPQVVPTLNCKKWFSSGYYNTQNGALIQVTLGSVKQVNYKSHRRTWVNN